MARYGNQPLTVARHMTARELGQFVTQLNEIVQEENAPRRTSAED